MSVIKSLLSRGTPSHGAPAWLSLDPHTSCCFISSLRPCRTAGCWRRWVYRTGAGTGEGWGTGDSQVYCRSPLNVKVEARLCSQMSLRTHYYTYRSPLPLPAPAHHGPPGISTHGIDRASKAGSQASSPGQGQANHSAQKSQFCSDNPLIC